MNVPYVSLRLKRYDIFNTHSSAFGTNASSCIIVHVLLFLEFQNWFNHSTQDEIKLKILYLSMHMFNHIYACKKLSKLASSLHKFHNYYKFKISKLRLTFNLIFFYNLFASLVKQLQNFQKCVHSHVASCKGSVKHYTAEKAIRPVFHMTIRMSFFIRPQ